MTDTIAHKPYRPRRIRSGTPPPFQLTERDVEIVRLVARHRFLNSQHIWRLVGGSAKNINNRLKMLFEHGVLNRPPIQFDTYRLGGGTSPLVYALADKGAQLLMGSTEGTDSKRISWAHKNKSAGRPFLQHTLATADFAVALQLSVSARDDVELIDGDELISGFPTKTQARNKPYRLNVPVIYHGGRIDIGVEPDYAFSLSVSFPKSGHRYSDKNDTQQISTEARRRAFFLVEIDCGTMPVARRDLRQSSIMRKLHAYQTMWKSKTHNVHFGWRNFRVLFVTTSQERVENMIAATNAQALTKGSPLFLYSDKHSLYNLDDTLDYKWLGANGDMQSLLPAL